MASDGEYTIKYKEGMTWGEWAISSHNTTNITIDGNFFRDSKYVFFYVDDWSSGCEGEVTVDRIMNEEYSFRLGWDLGLC